MQPCTTFALPAPRIHMSPRIALASTLLLASLLGCERSDRSTDDPPPELTLPDGFRSEVLFHPSKEDTSSWVSLAVDGRGGLLASDQHGNLYRITVPPIGSDDADVQVEKLDLELGHAQGLLWVFNSLYVIVNSEEGIEGRSSGLYRVIDSDGDSELDSVRALAHFDGWGEHGPHGIVLGPDHESLYLVIGNHTELPEAYHAIVPPVWGEDQLIEALRDPRGHAASRKAPGGYVLRTDSTGSPLELVSVGYRNAYDLAFTPDGELFTFDSDMEWDLGMPWYRPIRVLHVTSGSEFGWRTGSGKWPEYYPDNLPSVAELGQGSPTGVLAGTNAAFPRKYREGIFVFDWSFGTIYHVALQEHGASYRGEVTEFLSGVPLPVTDGVISPDGALYFTTGGRRLNSFLFRVYYDGPVTEDAHVPEASPQLELRRKLEAWHGALPDPSIIDQAWPHLSHADRFVRYAARIAIEHQPVGAWEARALSEPDPVRRIQAIVALARHGNKSIAAAAYEALLAIDGSLLSRAQELDWLRAVSLVMIRMEAPIGTHRAALIERADARFPSMDNALNREYGQLLAALEAPGIAAKMLTRLTRLAERGPGQTALLSEEVTARSEQYGEAITEMRANPPSPEEIDLVLSLRTVRDGWTIDMRREFFTWFYDAMRRSGGHSYVGFIEDMRSDAVELLTEEDREALAGLVDASPVRSLAGLPQPEGPGRKWNRQEIGELLNDALGEPRDLESGRRMFQAALCSTCHRMESMGGSIGPDLTAVGTRFGRHEIVGAIDLPSDEISDQYAAQIIERADGSTLTGRIVDEDRQTLTLSQNPYDPSQQIVIEKADVVGREDSPVSIMPARLLDRLNGEEIADLMAYLISGGDPEHRCYTGDKGCQTRDEGE